MESGVNTYIFDTESATELARLINQDRAITKAMGGALSGIIDTQALHNIVDLGCGPGGWVLDAAFTLRHAEIEGVDVSRKMVDYANARARTQLLPNASFGVMDITAPLELPDHSFDLVNARFLAAVLKREAWPPFLLECDRVLRPGGCLRLTDATDFSTTTSKSVNHMIDLICSALYQLGYGFTLDHTPGLLPAILSSLRQQGYQSITVIAHTLDYSAKTEAWTDMYHNIDIISCQMKPILIKLGLINEELFDRLYQQTMIDLQMDAFCGIGHVTTIIGQKPEAE